MPQGNGAPPITLDEGVFDALKVMSYSSTNKAFVDGSSNNIYMFVDKDANGAPRWFYATNTDGAEHPRGEIPSLTSAVIRNGTYNAQTGAVSYNGSNYKFRLERDTTNGTHIAKAYTV